MEVRLGATVVTANGMLLALALAVFLWTAYHGLHPDVLVRRRDALLALAWGTAGGAAGAWLYGLPAMLGPHAPSELAWSRYFSFGSFGGFWGVFAGLAVAGLTLRRAPVPVLIDAAVPAVIWGGIVARVGSLFAGTNRGIELSTAVFGGFQPFRPWPAYDIAALLLTLAFLKRRSRRTGTPVLAFLIGYGTLRFVLEFVRDTDRPVGPFTWGHAMSALQIGAGLLLLCALLRRSSAGADQSLPENG